MKASWVGLVVILVTVSTVMTQSVVMELTDFSTCCHFCRGDQDLWTHVEPTWNLTVQEELVSELLDPQGFLVDDECKAEVNLYDRMYVINYAGAPVKILYESINTEASLILNNQFVEYDLGALKDVAGVVIQGGYYADSEDDLFERRDAWSTAFAVSYALQVGDQFQYIRNDGGAIERFDGNVDAVHSIIRGFPGITRLRLLRVHPLAGSDNFGSTSDVMVRASLATCSSDSFCVTPRVNCILNQWQAWGECLCDWAGCRQRRMRTVGRYEACGGVPCEGSTEYQKCEITEPLWKTILLWVGIGLLILIVLIIIIVVPVKLHQKKKRQETVFDRDASKGRRGKDVHTSQEQLTEENIDDGDTGYGKKKVTFAPRVDVTNTSFSSDDDLYADQNAMDTPPPISHPSNHVTPRQVQPTVRGRPTLETEDSDVDFSEYGL